MKVTINARFKFPGFTATQRADTELFDIEIGTIVDNDVTFELTLQRMKGYKQFVLAEVRKPGVEEPLWEYKNSGFGTRALLAKAGDEIVIAEAGANVTRIVSLRVLLGEKFYLKRYVELKHLAAKHLNIKPMWTEWEWEELHADSNAEERSKREKERVEKARAKEAKQRQLEQLVAKLKKRDAMTAYTQNGQTRTGIPVSDDEWKHLIGKHVILMDSSNTPIEAFKVVKRTGKPVEKAQCASVTAEPQSASLTGDDASSQGATTEHVTAQEVHRVMVTDKKKRQIPVEVFPTMSDVRAARELGSIATGTYVSAKDRVVDDGRIEVFRIASKGMDTIGRCTPV